MDQVFDVIKDAIFDALEVRNYDIERISILSDKITYRVKVADLTHIFIPIRVPNANKTTEANAVYMWETESEKWVRHLRGATEDWEIIFQADPGYESPGLEFPGLWFRYQIIMNSPKFPRHVQFCRFPMKMLINCIDMDVKAKAFYDKAVQLSPGMA